MCSLFVLVEVHCYRTHTQIHMKKSNCYRTHTQMNMNMETVWIDLKCANSKNHLHRRLILWCYNARPLRLF